MGGLLWKKNFIYSRNLVYIELVLGKLSNISNLLLSFYVGPNKVYRALMNFCKKQCIVNFQYLLEYVLYVQQTGLSYFVSCS